MAVVQVYAKVTKVRGELLVAICDEDVLGKCFEDKEKRVVFEVRESFYKGEKIEISESIKLLKPATIVNLTGPAIVDAAVKAGYVDAPNVIVIGGIPHAQIIKL
ncbi:MAG: DUF424 family protein [Candidatus Bathyarchaeia archaeon]